MASESPDPLQTAKPPKVSVAMLTYNHAQFIRQALDSVLMQVTNFDYEIVIGDDLSTDDTRQILLEYQARYPDRFRLLLYATKQGVGGNILAVLNHCQGDYIALLEGDDYWTDPHKLQMQVDVLDSDPQCALCFHAYQIYSEAEKRFLSTIEFEKAEYTLEDLLQLKLYPATHTNVFRTNAMRLPEWVRSLWNIDDVIAMTCAQHGMLRYIHRYMSVYRVHSGGIYSGSRRSVAILNTIKTREAMLQNFNHKHLAHYKFYDLRPLYLKAMYFLDAEGDKPAARCCLYKAMRLTRLTPRQLKQLAAAIAIVYFNPLHRIYLTLKQRLLVHRS